MNIVKNANRITCYYDKVDIKYQIVEEDEDGDLIDGDTIEYSLHDIYVTIYSVCPSQPLNTTNFNVVSSLNCIHPNINVGDQSLCLEEWYTPLSNLIRNKQYEAIWWLIYDYLTTPNDYGGYGSITQDDVDDYLSRLNQCIVCDYAHLEGITNQYGIHVCDSITCKSKLDLINFNTLKTLSSLKVCSYCHKCYYKFLKRCPECLK